MKIYAKLGALLGAAVLLFALGGGVFAASVTPTTVYGHNITLDGNGNSDSAGCEDGIELDAAGSDTTPGGVTVTMFYNSTTKEVSFTADGGVVLKAFIKGGDAYNIYDYSPDGVTSDNGLVAPKTGPTHTGPRAGLSHAVFCTEMGEQTAPPSFEPSFNQSFEGETQCNCDADLVGTADSSSPSDASWLLVVAMGVLLASAVVLTPARIRNRK
jgi:hypothetical protein